ncbi:hypothetical protein AHF37_04628 [Paragonimus kellicotti]|nr:hypothetical protein AHF37_04628 [Paragonimus kellicotti]
MYQNCKEPQFNALILTIGNLFCEIMRRRCIEDSAGFVANTKLTNQLVRLNCPLLSPIQQDDSSDSVDRTLLEQRIRALEEELNLARENGKKAIRSLQQQYETVKFHYEERIQALQLLVHHPQVVKRPPDDKTEDQLKSKISSRPTLTLDPDDSQRVQHLLLKLHSQIHHLKQELTNRQRSIEQVEHFTRLNSSTEVGHPHRNSRARASRTTKKTVSPKMIETPLKVINHIPSGKHDITEFDNRVSGQATLSASRPTNKDVAILTKLDELVEKKGEISTTDDAQMLEVRLFPFPIRSYNASIFHVLCCGP